MRSIKEKVQDISNNHNIFEISLLIAGKTLFDSTNLFSPNVYEKNTNMIYKCFKRNYGYEETMKKILKMQKNTPIKSSSHRRTIQNRLILVSSSAV